MLLPRLDCYARRLCPLLFGLSFMLIVHAQEPIDIFGTVIDNYGVRTQNAEVRIRGTEISSKTNAQGEFHLSGVLAPQQTIAGAVLDVSKEGYFPERRELTSASGTLDLITIRDDIIIPQPQSILFPSPPVPLPKRIVLEACPSANLTAQLKTIARGWDIQILEAPGPQKCPRIRINFGTSAEASLKSKQDGEQGYVLDVKSTPDGILIDALGGDEAGAFYALQSLRNLIYQEGDALFIRPVQIVDWPAIKHRGLILGMSDSYPVEKTRVDFCSRLKLNLAVHCGLGGAWNDSPFRTGTPDFKTFCDARYVEFAALIGYRQGLVEMGDAVTGYYDERFDSGIRSFTVDFDDYYISSMEASQTLANAHADVANKVYRHLRERDPAVHFVFCPLVYGGRPSTYLVGAASRDIGVNYLKILGDTLPADMPMFWTGDGGVFSNTVTEAGAREISNATQGRKPFLWDNNAIFFANGRQPLSGRGLELYKYLSGYMANLNEWETDWRPDKNVEFELITTAMYCWNPQKYDPAKAAIVAEDYLSSIQVPFGNIAVTVSSKSDEWGWQPYCAVDGQRSSTPDTMGWSSSSSPELDHSEWIQLDLGTLRSLYRVELYPRNDGANTGYGFPVDFTIATSTGDGQWNTVITRNDYPQPDGSVQSFTFAPVTARYILITGTKLRPNPNENNEYRMQLAEITIGYEMPPSSSADIDLVAGSAAEARTVGSNETTQAGYAVLTVDSGTTPYGTAVFSFKQNGVTVTEAGVPASPPTTAARIFIDYRSAAPAVPGRIEAGAVDVNTGIAVVNRGSATANVTYLLRDISGSTLSIGHGTIAAGTHFAKFINQLKDVASDFNPSPDFQSTIRFGSLEISSDQPLSVVALRMTTNQRNEVLFTTTPTADLTQSLTSTPMYFPQFADGGGYTTALVLLNTSNGIETGTFRILDDLGAPLVVNQIGGTADSSFKYAIAPSGAFRFQTDGFPASTKVGWVRLMPDGGTITPVGAGMFGYNPGNVLVTESGIPAAASTTHARVYVDLSGGHNTGLAIANLAAARADIFIRAFQSDGTTGIGTSQGPLQLQAKGHSAKFAGEFVSGLPAEFAGLLDIRSATPFAALTMRSLTNERGDFLLTTFPIADMNRAAPAPIVFPQIADGGGYVTQFILLSSGGASSATLNFYGEAGAPLVVGKQ